MAHSTPSPGIPILPVFQLPFGIHSEKLTLTKMAAWQPFLSKSSSISPPVAME
jgi:hypothetical protein